MKFENRSAFGVVTERVAQWSTARFSFRATLSVVFNIFTTYGNRVRLSHLLVDTSVESYR